MDFKKVSNKYRSVPFWSWNERLQKEETKRQIGLMEEQGIGGFFMHARGGLQTEYMGEEWFNNVEVCADECEKKGMHLWAYDENGWPSGFGGGIVNGKGIEYQQKYLRMTDDDGEHGENTIACEGGKKFYYEVNPYYVDTLDGKVIHEFIESIYEPYYKKFKGRIDGFFTDEPQISRNGIPWSFILPEEYEKAYGDDLLTLLPQLFLEEGDYITTRIRFWKLVTELFSKNYMKQIYDWCNEHNFKFTGHLVCEETFETQLASNGACMSHYEYMSIPGMDWLGRHNNRSLTPYQVGSASRQMGKKQVLSETFAMCGHNVGHDELKWIYEYQMVRGINLLCQHLEGYSNRGLRKRDYPPAMYIQQPWWDEYKTFNDAMSRIGMLLSEGDDAVDVLVIHPQTTAWTIYNGCGSHKIKDTKLNSSEMLSNYNEYFLDLLKTLENKHINFHLGDEIMIERHGRVEGKEFIIGSKRYSKVIIPEHEVFFENTEELLSQFRENGGIITSADEIEANDIINVPEIVYCERHCSDYDMYYFVNSTENTYNAYIKKGNKIMDPATGELYDFDGYHVFKKYESLVVIDDRTEGERPQHTDNKSLVPIDLLGKWLIKSNSENSLTLDYCDYYFDGVLSEKHGYILNAMYRAIDIGKPVNIRCEYRVTFDYIPTTIYLVCETPEIFDIKVNGLAVDKTPCGYFRDKSFIKLDISKLVKLGENIITSEVYFCQSDKVYKNIEKSRHFESEKNKLTFDMEIEQIYLVGDFSVSTPGEFTDLERRAARYKGDFIISEPCREIRLDNINRQGFPFFAGTIVLKKTFYAEERNMMIDFEKCGINVVKAKVNGKELAPMLYEPYTADISEYIKIGENEIELTLINNLRNLQGPFHLTEGESYLVGPNSFYKENCIWYNGGNDGRWNDDYCFVEMSLTNRKK